MGILLILIISSPLLNLLHLKEQMNGLFQKKMLEEEFLNPQWGQQQGNAARDYYLQAYEQEVADQIKKSLEKILGEQKEHYRWARQITEFFMGRYPEQIPILLASHEMEKLLDQRVKEAWEYFQKMYPEKQEREQVWQMDTLQRIQKENQIQQEIQSMIETEILYRPLNL